MKKRLTSDVVIFTVLTSWVYYFYWIADTQNGIREKTGRGFSAGVTLLLFFFTGGVYPFIWWYDLGEKLQKLGAESNNGLRYLLCMLIPYLAAIFFVSVGILAVGMRNETALAVSMILAILMSVGCLGSILGNMIAAQNAINEIVSGSSADNGGNIIA